jgi:hypothetical protein
VVDEGEEHRHAARERREKKVGNHSGVRTVAVDGEKKKKGTAPTEHQPGISTLTKTCADTVAARRRNEAADE